MSENNENSKIDDETTESDIDYKEYRKMRQNHVDKYTHIICDNAYKLGNNAKKQTFDVHRTSGIIMDPQTDYTKKETYKTYHEIDNIQKGKWCISNISSDKDQFAYILQHVNSNQNSNNIEHEIIHDLCNYKRYMGFFPFPRDELDVEYLFEFSKFETEYKLYRRCAVIYSDNETYMGFSVDVVLSKINGKIFRIALIEH